MLNLEASQLGSLVTQQGWSSGGDMVRTFSSIKRQLGMLNPTLFFSFRFCCLKTCTIIPGEAKHVTTHELSISAIALPPHPVSPHMCPSPLRLQSRRHKAAYQIHSGLHFYFLYVTSAAMTLSCRFEPLWVVWKAFEGLQNAICGV